MMLNKNTLTGCPDARPDWCPHHGHKDIGVGPYF